MKKNLPEVLPSIDGLREFANLVKGKLSRSPSKVKVGNGKQIA